MSQQTISVQDGPGSCPICGMALEPRTVEVDFNEASVSIEAIHAAIEEQGYEVATG